MGYIFFRDIINEGGNKVGKLAAVILAAGQGTRMKSHLPKVLFPLAGKPILQHVVDMLVRVGVEKTIIVVGHGSQQVKEQIQGDITWVEQHPQLGTGHALFQARDELAGYSGDVLVLCGDAPLLTPQTVTDFVAAHCDSAADATVLSALMDDPTGYGRILREKGCNVKAIVEQRDASEQHLEIKEINSGSFCFQWQAAVDKLASLDKDNSQGEYYLTDIISSIHRSGGKVEAFPVSDSSEVMGINDRVQLAAAEKIIRRRINAGLMYDGVTIVDPDTTWIDADVRVGRDSVILPNTHIKGKTQAGENCKLGPDSFIEDCVLGQEVIIRNSVAEESSIGDKTSVGPYAYIRPGCTIGRGVRIGDFVELKKARIGDGSKVPHLSYVGDALVGSGVNIGCGVITANYDGHKKHITDIGDEAFIGSNSNLVAPLKIGARAYVAAGSTINRDVPEGSLAIARSRQSVKENWGRKD